MFIIPACALFPKFPYRNIQPHSASVPTSVVALSGFEPKARELMRLPPYQPEQFLYFTSYYYFLQVFFHNQASRFHHTQNILYVHRKSDSLFNYNVGDVGIEPTMPEATVLQTASPPWRISPLSAPRGA